MPTSTPDPDPQPDSAKSPQPRLIRQRWIVLVLAVCGVASVVRPSVHLLRMMITDVDGRPALPAGHVDDASRLNQTRVAERVDVDSDMATAERELAALLARARREKLVVSIAGTRHSMGGQSFVPHGLVVNMLPLNAMSLDAEKSLLHVEAGAVWSDIIPYLDAHGFSVGVMQSNNAFSVGGSLSVNCHGWQYGRPPIASTVESFRLMKADGSVIRCSRTENADLFGLALGGYGLFGIILGSRCSKTAPPTRPTFCTSISCREPASTISSSPCGGSFRPTAATC